MSADAYARTEAQTQNTTRPRAGAPTTSQDDPWRVEEDAPTVENTQVTFDYRNRTRCPNCCDGTNQKIA